jgi:hypothetical protein
MRTIRASEIGAFIYCQRAWRYQQQGYESENQAELASGSEIHHRHGRAVLVSGCLRTAAYLALLCALALLAIYLTGKIL